ncbi:MAG: DUF3791 domain-containing protein [Roseburia sp.]|nr:DUF3791 domain-containing protein [Roseburia sp.]
MGNEMLFFIFLLENYAEYKNTTGDEVLRLWDKLKLTDFIYDMYERYHAERLENAFEDIDKLVEEKVS